MGGSSLIYPDMKTRAIVSQCGYHPARTQQTSVVLTHLDIILISRELGPEHLVVTNKSHLMTVAIAGAASTKFGKHPESSARQLFHDAAETAIDETPLVVSDIESVFVGNFMGALTDDQGHMGALMADYVGVPKAMSTTIESACASAGTAVRQATQAIEAGVCDIALVGGVEMMFSTGIEKITDALANAADNEYENQAGLTFPGIYALIADEYLSEFDATREELAAVAVKNRENGVSNPISQFRESITVEEVLGARTIAPPLGMMDCCPITDGASAVVLVSETYARENGFNPTVTIAGSGQAGDTIALQDREELARTRAAERAAEQAYEDAAIGPEDVDVCEVHDCFTIAEILAIESLGFFERGTGASAAQDGETAIDGHIPVNTSGGLIAKGHPVGATGVAQLVEITKQLEGRHPNQVDDAEIGLTHNVGGSGASAVVHVLEGSR